MRGYDRSGASAKRVTGESERDETKIELPQGREHGTS